MTAVAVSFGAAALMWTGYEFVRRRKGFRLRADENRWEVVRRPLSDSRDQISGVTPDLIAIDWKPPDHGEVVGTLRLQPADGDVVELAATPPD